MAFLGFVAPGTASAYVDESAVETIPGGGVGDELTGPAKTILERPTFLAEDVTRAATVGPAEEAGAASIFEGAGILPGIGAVIGSFSAGVGIGSLICNEVLELEGCLKLTSTGESAAPGVEGAWSWKSFPGCAGTSTGPSYAWYFTLSGNCNLGWTNLGGNGPKCGVAPPASYDSFVPLTPNQECGSEPGVKHSSGAIVKYAMQNRALQGMTKAQAAGSGFAKYTGSGYCPSETPTTCASKPPSNWSERMARGLHSSAAGVSEATRNRVGESIAAEIAGSGVRSPYKTYVEVPSCSGEAWIGCKEQLEELDLVPQREEVSWSEVETSVPNEVLSLDPAPKTELVTKSTVTVVTNPGLAGMPLLIPRPGSVETYTEYISRLAPSLDPHRQVVRDSEIDSSAGPAGVLAVQPQPGTKLNPAVSHEVNVDTNPDSVPGGGAWSPPSVPSINMEPLSGFKPCGVFPFGLFCWMGEAFGQFNTTGSCPKAAVPVASTHFELSLCGESAEQVMSIARPALLLIFIVGCGLMFARGTKAIGDD